MDLVQAGIIDPAKVVRAALQDAASVGGLLVTTEAMVAERPKKENGMPMPGGGGGMGGMGGMKPLNSPRIENGRVARPFFLQQYRIGALADRPEGCDFLYPVLSALRHR